MRTLILALTFAFSLGTVGAAWAHCSGAAHETKNDFETPPPASSSAAPPKQG